MSEYEDMTYLINFTISLTAASDSFHGGGGGFRGGRGGQLGL